MLSYVSYNKIRFIILKLGLELVEIIIKDTINKILYIKVKSEIFSTKSKKNIYKKV